MPSMENTRHNSLPSEAEVRPPSGESDGSKKPPESSELKMPAHDFRQDYHNEQRTPVKPEGGDVGKPQEQGETKAPTEKQPIQDQGTKRGLE